MSNRCRACNCRYSSMGRLVRHLARTGRDETHVAFQQLAREILKQRHIPPVPITTDGKVVVQVDLVKSLQLLEQQYAVSMGWIENE